MHPYLSAVIAAEHQKDLLAAADRQRLAAAAAPRPALPLRLRQRLALVGSRVSGRTRFIGQPSDSS